MSFVAAAIVGVGFVAAAIVVGLVVLVGVDRLVADLVVRVIFAAVVVAGVSIAV